MEISSTRPSIKQPWLSMIRVAWTLLAMFNLLPGLLGLPAYYRQLVAMDPWPNNGGWNPENFRAAFVHSGVNPQVFSWLVLIPAAIQIFITVSIGLIIYRQQSREWLGLLASYLLVGLGGTFAGDRYQFLQVLPPIWRMIGQEIGVVLWLGYFLFMILFPNGKFQPHWMRWVAVVLIVWFILTEVWNRSTGQYPGWLSVSGFVLMALILVGKYRQYRYLASATERQQIRWFLYAIAILILYGLSTLVYNQAYPIPQQPGMKELIRYLVLVYLGSLTGILVPISIAIAIFRYRLWDIDLVIRRTLSYTVLTGLLGLVYFGLVTLLQALFVGASGQQSPLALVISTLVIAALFTPLRRRIQQVLDRRFFRQRYDADQTLEAFSSAARQETDLERLSASLVGTVQQSIQPESVALWMRRGQGDINRREI